MLNQGFSLLVFCWLRIREHPRINVDLQLLVEHRMDDTLRTVVQDERTLNLILKPSILGGFS